MKHPDHPDERDHRACREEDEAASTPHPHGEVGWHILRILARGARGRHSLQDEIMVARGWDRAAYAEIRVGSALHSLTKRGFVLMHPIHGFKLTAKGRAALADREEEA